jgi:hypothetical protein
MVSLHKTLPDKQSLLCLHKTLFMICNLGNLHKTVPVKHNLFCLQKHCLSNAIRRVYKEHCQSNTICGVYKQGGADKSLARPGRKKPTGSKLRIYSSHSPRRSMHFLARCSNFSKPLKKVQKIVRPIRSSRQQ